MNMNKKLKIVLITLIIGISGSCVQAQNTDKVIGGFGIGFLSKLSNPKFILESLETDPEATTNYFDKNPLNYNPVANVLLSKIKTVQTEDEYNRLYRIAELMGLNEIPPYGSHPRDYIEKVNDEIKIANQLGGEAAVRLRLEQLRDILSNAKKNDSWRTVL